jgi:hypothetical protein
MEATGHKTVRRVPLGQVVVTAGVSEWQKQRPVVGRLLFECLQRHEWNDWGEVCDEDKAANDSALIHGDRLLSAYTVEGTKIWVITEADRAATTALFPDEY